jgi:polysaccharide export outer membrane protein
MSVGRIVVTCALALGLGGCGEYMQFPVSQQGQERLPAHLEVIRVSKENVGEVTSVYYERRSEGGGTPPPDPGRYTYRLGAGDQLRVQVWTTPERATTGGEQNLQPVEGPIIDETGHFFYPFVGEVHAEGRTVGEIRVELTQKLRTYLTDPQVEVAVQEFRAHRVMVTGAVGEPRPTRLTNVPLRLIDLINGAGTDEMSDLAHVVLRRQGREYTVNVRAFLEHGVMRQNPVLLPGDTVHVPRDTESQAFVFGEISTAEVPLAAGDKSLTEVLAEVGGIDRTRANAKGIFVFRRTDVEREGFDVVFQFDLSDAATLVLMKDFPIAPQDIIFVTKDPVTRWTDSVSRVLAPASSLLQARAIVDSLENGD